MSRDVRALSHVSRARLSITKITDYSDNILTPTVKLKAELKADILEELNRCFLNCPLMAAWHGAQLFKPK